MAADHAHTESVLQDSADLLAYLEAKAKEDDESGRDGLPERTQSTKTFPALLNTSRTLAKTSRTL